MRYDWEARGMAALIGGFIVGAIGLCPASIIGAVVVEELGEDHPAYLGVIFLFPLLGAVVGLAAPGLIDWLLKDRSRSRRRGDAGPGEGPDDDGGIPAPDSGASAGDSGD
jgi:hypothetical protein